MLQLRQLINSVVQRLAGNASSSDQEAKSFKKPILAIGVGPRWIRLSSLLTINTPLQQRLCDYAVWAAGRRPRRLSIYLTELTVHGGSELTGGRLTAMWSAVLVGGGRAAGQMPKLVLGRDGHGVLDDGLHSEGRDGWVLERGAQGPWREFCITSSNLTSTQTIYLSRAAVPQPSTETIYLC